MNPRDHRMLGASALFLSVGIVCLCGLTGCAFPNLSKIDAQIPDGNWKQARAGITGKFTSTKLEATGTKENGKWTKGELHFKHSNPWVPDAYLDLIVQENR